MKSFTVLHAQVAAPAAPKADGLSPELLGVVGAIALGISGFVVKFLFDQAVESWSRRIKALEEDSQALDVRQEKLEAISFRQSDAAEQLALGVKELTSQVAALNELQHRLVLVAERQNTFDQRLQNYGGALQELQRAYQEAQKEALNLKAELATNYLRREDWLRFTNTLDAKLDAINRQVGDYKEILFERLKPHE